MKFIKRFAQALGLIAALSAGLLAAGAMAGGETYCKDKCPPRETITVTNVETITTPDETVTVTNTETVTVPGPTETVTEPGQTVTVTQPGNTTTVTNTVTVPGPTVTETSPPVTVTETVPGPERVVTKTVIKKQVKWRTKVKWKVKKIKVKWCPIPPDKKKKKVCAKGLTLRNGRCGVEGSG